MQRSQPVSYHQGNELCSGHAHHTAQTRTHQPRKTHRKIQACRRSGGGHSRKIRSSNLHRRTRGTLMELVWAPHRSQQVACHPSHCTHPEHACPHQLPALVHAVVLHHCTTLYRNTNHPMRSHHLNNRMYLILRTELHCRSLLMHRPPGLL